MTNHGQKHVSTTCIAKRKGRAGKHILTGSARAILNRRVAGPRIIPGELEGELDRRGYSSHMLGRANLYWLIHVFGSQSRRASPVSWHADSDDASVVCIGRCWHRSGTYGRADAAAAAALRQRGRTECQVVTSPCKAQYNTEYPGMGHAVDGIASLSWLTIRQIDRDCRKRVDIYELNGLDRSR